MALASPLCSSRQKLSQMGIGAQGSRLCQPAGIAAPRLGHILSGWEQEMESQTLGAAGVGGGTVA